VPIRSAINPFLRFASCAFLLLVATAGAATETLHTLTLVQARAIAVQALQAGRPELTLQLADGLLRADPRDPFTHYLMAHAHARQNEPSAARKSAARAYRFSSEHGDKFEAAQLAAQLSYAEEKPTLTQLWLRRSAIHAPNEKMEQVVARDFRKVRAANPWAFRIRGDLRPSSNVNNGADTALQIIDGVPVTGFLSGTAQALSGLIGSLDVATTYRLQSSPQSATSVGGRLYIQRVALSSEAQQLAPTARNSDYATTYAELSVRHGFAVGQPGRGGAAWVDLAAGRAWSGDASNYSFARLSGERSWRLRGGQRLRINALVEDRFDSRYATNDAQVFGLGAQLMQPLQNGDQVTFTLALRDSNASHFNGTYMSGSVRTNYAFDQPVGGMRFNAGLVLGYSDYPVYQSGLFIVPGGRQDKSVYGDFGILFERYDYAGFAPMLRLRAGRKSSNDSRFDIQELSVSLGIESKF